MSETSDAKPARNTRQKNRSASYSKVCVAKTVSQKYAVEKIFTPICTTSGLKTFWKDLN